MLNKWSFSVFANKDLGSAFSLTQTSVLASGPCSDSRLCVTWILISLPQSNLPSCSPSCQVLLSSFSHYDDGESCPLTLLQLKKLCDVLSLYFITLLTFLWHLIIYSNHTNMLWVLPRLIYEFIISEGADILCLFSRFVLTVFPLWSVCLLCLLRWCICVPDMCVF